MFKNLNVKNKITLISFGLILLGFSLSSYIVSTFSYNKMLKSLNENLFTQVNLVKDVLDAYNTSAKENADKTASLFVNMAGNVEIDTSNLIKVGEHNVPALKSDGIIQNNQFDIVDTFTKYTNGSVATYFVRQDDDFIRISTSLKKQDGNRAIATKLDRKHPAYEKLLNGQEFIGKATLFGKQYVTKYIPVMKDNKCIAVLFVGADISKSYADLTNNIKKLKVGESGYFYALDLTNGDKKGTFLIHPTLEGKNGLKIDEENKTDIYKQILEPKDGGNIHYEESVEKFVIFQPFNEWKLMIVAHGITEEVTKDAVSLRNVTIISGIIASLLIGFALYFGLAQSLKAIDEIQNGLISFFKFLNRETLNAEYIKIEREDEFGQMAKVINSNIKNIKENINKDNETVREALEVVEKIKQGSLTSRINSNPSNPQLVQLKDALNLAVESLNSNISKILHTLDSFGNYNFKVKTDKGNLNSEIAGLIDGINKLGDEISKMLKTSLENGYLLLSNSKELTKMVEELSNSSNEQAASLEETAASLEEITSLIRQTTQRANEMAKISNETKQSAQDGMKLTNKTSTAMQEIENASTTINEAVTVIENIAFQTNILSLNAAVEAATAGEAGKGFAVVAAEVRNLASRSAEAARTIKNLVDEAQIKTTEGKKASEDMINGFIELSKKIESSSLLVQEVTTATKEQMQGVEQINSTVSSIDRMTQENASVAQQTSLISEKVSKMATDLVNDANKKEFIGKIS